MVRTVLRCTLIRELRSTHGGRKRGTLAARTGATQDVAIHLHMQAYHPVADWAATSRPLDSVGLHTARHFRVKVRVGFGGHGYSEI